MRIKREVGTTLISDLNEPRAPRMSAAGKSVSVEGLSPSKRRLFRVLTLLFSVALSVGAAELGLRILGWPAPGFYSNGRGPITLLQPGAKGGAFPPESAGRLRHYDYDVEWMVNAQGFRDRELYPKMPGEWRVGILGDSFATGFGVERNQRFTDVWYDAVKGKYPQVSLWNLASPLCGTICEREIFEGVGRHYDLDEVLLVFYGGNDVEDNFEWVTHPGQQDPYSELTRTERARQWLREHSRLTTFLWINGFRALANIKPPGIYSESDLNRYWPYTAQALADLKQSIGSRRLTILYLPALPEWDNSSWLKVRDRSGAGDGDRFRVKQALKDWSGKEKITFLDSTSWLAQCRDANDCIFPTDGHINVRGHAIIGRELADSWSIKGSDEGH